MPSSRFGLLLITTVFLPLLHLVTRYRSFQNLNYRVWIPPSFLPFYTAMQGAPFDHDHDFHSFVGQEHTRGSR